MNKFSWYEAKSVEDAVGKVNATSSDILGKQPNGSSVIFKAGGIDLLDLMKEGLVNPKTSVQLGIRVHNSDSYDFNIINAPEIMRHHIDDTIEKIHRIVTDTQVYLSFDID